MEFKLNYSILIDTIENVDVENIFVEYLVDIPPTWKYNCSTKVKLNKRKLERIDRMQAWNDSFSRNKKKKEP